MRAVHRFLFHAIGNSTSLQEEAKTARRLLGQVDAGVNAHPSVRSLQISSHLTGSNELSTTIFGALESIEQSLHRIGVLVQTTVETKRVC